jgi:hypothetical protein
VLIDVGGLVALGTCHLLLALLTKEIKKVKFLAI